MHHLLYWDSYGIETEVAIKLWPLPTLKKNRTDVLKQLHREHEVLLTVHSQHVVHMYSAIKEVAAFGSQKWAALVMELAQENLAQFVANRLPEVQREAKESGDVKHIEWVRWLVLQLIVAYNSCHRVGVGHKDVKPENILIARELASNGGPLLKLCDFALSRFFNNPNSTKTYTVQRSADPTNQRVWYAPETSPLPGAGEPVQRLASDVWSLGCVLVFIATGDAPFKTDEEVRACRDEQQRIKFLSRNNLRASMPLLFDLVERMTRFEPDDRIKMDRALHHPAVWSAQRVIAFIVDIVKAFNTRSCRAAVEMKQWLDDRERAKLVIGDSLNWAVPHTPEQKSIVPKLLAPPAEPVSASETAEISSLLRRLRNVLLCVPLPPSLMIVTKSHVSLTLSAGTIELGVQRKSWLLRIASFLGSLRSCRNSLRLVSSMANLPGTTRTATSLFSTATSRDGNVPLQLMSAK